MEMSPYPEKALTAGDTLVQLAPDAGHLVHMPTHIDVLCGDYQSVVERNDAAIVADRKFLARAGAMNFYSAYRTHNYHFKAYGAMFAKPLCCRFYARPHQMGPPTGWCPPYRRSRSCLGSLCRCHA